MEKEKGEKTMNIDKKVDNLLSGNMKKSTKVLGVLTILVASTLVVSAGLLSFYGKVETTANVQQSVQLRNVGGSWRNWDNPIDANISTVGGDCEIEDFEIRNQASIEAKIGIDTSITKDSIWVNPDPSVGGVNVSVLVPAEYTKEFLAEDTILDGTDVSVEATDDWVIWTMEVPLNGTHGTGLGSGGQAAWSISIGQGSEILYQIHNNDGTDGNYANGKYLYSEYDNGWHTGSDNTPVSAISWIQATGTRTAAVCGGIYTIKIDRDELGDEFKWAAHINYESDSLPKDFGWGDTNTDNFYTAVLTEELTSPFTLQPGEQLDFVIKYCFDVAIEPDDDYTITTEFQPDN
jgi:hypothetical protein